MKTFLKQTTPFIILVFVLVLLVLGSCTSTPPIPTPTPTATEPALPDWYGWWNKPSEQWPSEIDGMRVCYVVVSQNTPLLKQSRENDQGVPIFTFSQVPEFGGTLLNQRTIAKTGKILMVWAQGDIWTHYEFIADDSPFCRPFQADGGNHVYWLMYEQIVDGRELWRHPDRPLFIWVKVINQEIVPGELLLEAVPVFSLP